MASLIAGVYHFRSLSQWCLTQRRFTQRVFLQGTETEMRPRRAHRLTANAQPRYASSVKRVGLSLILVAVLFLLPFTAKQGHMGGQFLHSGIPSRRNLRHADALRLHPACRRLQPPIL